MATKAQLTIALKDIEKLKAKIVALNGELELADERLRLEKAYSTELEKQNATTWKRVEERDTVIRYLARHWTRSMGESV